MAAVDDTRIASDNESQLPNDSNHVHDTLLHPQLSTPDELCDAKNSRKREREVSLEPSTPQAASLDIDSGRPETKERRTPAKKNRTSDGVLEATQEETEEDAPVSGSPPHETKIRQISQGVEDITWQNMKKDDLKKDDHPTQQPSPQKMEEVVPAHAEDEVAVDSVSEQPTPSKTPTSPTSTSVPPETTERTTLPPSLQCETPPVSNDTAGEEEDSGAAVGEEQLPDSQVSGAPQPAGAAFPTSTSVSTSSPETQLSSTARIPTTRRRGSDSDSEKGLKRKLGDRTVSEALLPGENPLSRNGVSPVLATKRPRDESEADPNTREKKRPTPPPDEDDKKPEAKADTAAPASPPKSGGFMAYASTSSPFASVQGPRLFGGKQPSTSPWTSAGTGSFSSGSSSSPFASTSTSPSPLAAAITAKEAASSAHSQTHKRTGFEAFASATSPFASAAKRPKSPPPPTNVLGRSRSPSRHGTPARATSAFSAYAAGGAQSFAAPTPKRSGAGTILGESSSSNVLSGGGSGSAPDSSKEDDDSEKDSGVSFGERLRAGKDKDEEEMSDEEKRLNLTEQEVLTGEEEEDTVYQVRGKLFALSSQNQWKERGTGMLRLNVRRADGGGARLVMRKEAVYAVLLNATLFKGMRCFLAQDPRYLRFSVIEDGAATHYNLRVSNAKIAEELLEEINMHIPSD